MSKIIILISLAFILFSCGGNKINKYVYVDKIGCVHIDKKCKKLNKYYNINFVDTSDITTFNCVKSYCSDCISDKAYIRLSKILNRNDNASNYFGRTRFNLRDSVHIYYNGNDVSISVKDFINRSIKYYRVKYPNSLVDLSYNSCYDKPIKRGYIFNNVEYDMYLSIGTCFY